MVIETETRYREEHGRAVVNRECHHHWVIESAVERASMGKCKLCGAEKEFKNHLPDCLLLGQDEYKGWLARQRA